MIEESKLPEGFVWCRKAKYDVQVELACYPLIDGASLLEGFEKKKF